MLVIFRGELDLERSRRHTQVCVQTFHDPNDFYKLFLAVRALAKEQAQLAQEKAKRRWAEMRVTQLEEMLRLLRLKKYGPQSESLADVYLPLFDEEPGVSLDEVAAEVSRPPLEETPPRKKKKHPGRQSLPADLQRVERIVACSPAECQCGQCGVSRQSRNVPQLAK